MKKALVFTLMLFLSVHLCVADAAASRRYGQKNIGPDEIAEGAFHATDSILEATGEVLLVVLTVPPLPLYILNTMMTGDNHSMHSGQVSYHSARYSAESRRRYSGQNTSYRNVKAGERVWKQY